MNNLSDPVQTVIAPVPHTGYAEAQIPIEQKPKDHHYVEDCALRSERLDLEEIMLEEGTAAISENLSTLKKSNDAIPAHPLRSAHLGETPSQLVCNTAVNKANGKVECKCRSFVTAVLRNLTRALGASVLAILGILACIPWISTKVFLGIVLTALVVPALETFTADHLLESRLYARHIFGLRLITFVSLSIMLYLMQDFPLWVIVLTSEVIQTTTIAFDVHYMKPQPTMKVIPKICLCLAGTLAHRIQLAFHAAMAIGVFYLNSRAIGISEPIQVAIVGIGFPIFQMLFAFQFSAYSAHMFGKKSVPWPGLEVAIEAAWAFLNQLSILLRFAFDRYFFTTILLNFLFRITVWHVVASALRFTGKPDSEKKHGWLVRYLNPFSERLKYTFTFAQVGKPIAAICAVVSSLVLANGDISMTLINKILVILLAEIGFNFVVVADELRNGRLVGEFAVWIGPLPGLVIIYIFGFYLITTALF